MRMKRRFADRNEGIMNPNLRRQDSSNYNYLPGKSTANYFGRSPLEELESKSSFGRDQISKRHMNRTGQNLSNYNSNYNYLPGKSTAAYFGRSPLEELESKSSFGRDQISKRHTPPPWWGKAPGEVENIDPVLGGDWMSKIGGALKNEFGGSAMAGELNRGIADYNPARVTGEEYLTDAEKLELGLSTNPAGSLLVNEPTPGLNPATPPKWYKPWTYMWGPNAGWNRGGIASLRRYR